jgi:hypothetical protein
MVERAIEPELVLGLIIGSGAFVLLVIVVVMTWFDR